MKTRRLAIAGGLIALLVVISFLAVPHSQDSPADDAHNSLTQTRGVPVVSVTDVFKKGTHTISGSVVAPDACTLATAEAFPVVGVESPSTTAILIRITMSADTGVCLELEKPVLFTASIDAPAQLPIEASVNGEVASTTIQ